MKLTERQVKAIIEGLYWQRCYHEGSATLMDNVSTPILDVEDLSDLYERIFNWNVVIALTPGMYSDLLYLVQTGKLRGNDEELRKALLEELE